MRPNSRTFVTALLAGTFATAAWAQELGRVHFETSCTPQAQEKFDRGLAMVHSFVYPDSVPPSPRPLPPIPQCAIAYWGIAISHRPNPLILPLTAAVLKNGLEAVEKGKAIGAKTERERDWLAAIELYYKDYDKVDQTNAWLAYEKAMEALMQKYPDDPEAAIFYALALNETALPSDKTYANQLKAGAILEKVLVDTTGPSRRAALSHPQLRLPAAGATRSCCRQQIRRGRPGCAACPAHALAYLFHARAVGAVGRSRTRNRGRSPRSKRPGSGRGRHTQASRTIWILWNTPCCKWGRKSVRSRSATTATRSRSSGSKAWLAIPGSPRFRRALRSNAKRGKKQPRLNREAASFRRPRPSLISPAPWDRPAAAISPLPSARSTSSRNFAPRWKRQASPIGPTQVEIQMLAASAWIAQAKGQKEEALKLMRAAADLEDNSEKHIAMENRLYPMRELLGDLLLEQQQPGPALTEYETSLLSTPNRLRGLYGAAKAAEGRKSAGEGDDLFPKACGVDQGRRCRSGGNQRGQGFFDAAVELP